jgi:hypothetical protein
MIKPSTWTNKRAQLSISGQTWLTPPKYLHGALRKQIYLGGTSTDELTCHHAKLLWSNLTPSN